MNALERRLALAMIRALPDRRLGDDAETSLDGYDVVHWQTVSNGRGEIDISITLRPADGDRAASIGVIRGVANG